jgi:hypothetical protein
MSEKQTSSSWNTLDQVGERFRRGFLDQIALSLESHAISTGAAFERRS